MRRSQPRRERRWRGRGSKEEMWAQGGVGKAWRAGKLGDAMWLKGR